MPRKKKTEIEAAEAAPATESAPVEKKSRKTRAKKSAEEDKPETTTPVDKPAVKRGRKPKVEQPAAEVKAPAEKRTVRKVEPKVAMKVQFGEREYDIDAIKSIILEACKGKVKSVKNVEIYVKPEDNAAYYIVNSEIEDKIDL